jgi:hypothetical protein
MTQEVGSLLIKCKALSSNPSNTKKKKKKKEVGGGRGRRKRSRKKMPFSLAAFSCTCCPPAVN